MRSIWSGSLAFGLVNIPVKLYVATDEKGLDLDMLHKKDMSPVRFARVCKREEKEIPYNELTRGFEIDKDDYVVLTEDELQKAKANRIKTIEILQFVKEAEIDTIYYEKPYYIEPTKGSEKSYSLLFEALSQSKKVGIARSVLRTRERIAVIKPFNNVLVVNQLRYSQDIRNTKELNVPEEKSVTKKEVDMALAFINQLTEPFKPQTFKDIFKNEIEKLIRIKSQGKRTTVEGELPKTSAKTADLMELLKKSLEQEKAGHSPLTQL